MVARLLTDDIFSQFESLLGCQLVLGDIFHSLTSLLGCQVTCCDPSQIPYGFDNHSYLYNSKYLVYTGPQVGGSSEHPICTLLYTAQLWILNALPFVSDPLTSVPLRITPIQASLVAAMHTACSRMNAEGKYIAVSWVREFSSCPADCHLMEI